MFNNSSSTNKLEIVGNKVDSISKTKTGAIYGIHEFATIANSRLLISGNQVSRIKTTSTGAIYGIFDGNSGKNVKKEIFSNQVYNLVTAGTKIYGICQSAGDSIRIY